MTQAGPPGEVIYRSSNGDRWELIEEPGTQRLLVRHQPNRASGGQPSLTGLRKFLDEGHGPQQEALLRLLADRQLTLDNTT